MTQAQNIAAVPDGAVLAGPLLDWYGRHRRDLPWRVPPGQRPDPYLVWLSEIMLQQTTVAAGRAPFLRFAARFPSVQELAAASRAEVLHAWQGLGYYARAHNLHRCAQMVVAHHGGRFPSSAAELHRLPGIGPYTAAAIAAIAFGEAATPVDANVERVVARLRAIEEPLPKARRRIAAEAAALTPADRPGDYVQAVMDLGALVCTPRAPDCPRCPWADACLAHARGLTTTLPRKAPKAEKPIRRGVAFWVVRADRHVLLRRRPERGLLGGMMEVPSTLWQETAPAEDEAARHAPLVAAWRRRAGLVRHGFTHFLLELTVWETEVPAGTPLPTGETGKSEAGEYEWASLDRLDAYALPTTMRKVVHHATASLPLSEPIFPAVSASSTCHPSAT